jgi:hypothetical protein
MTIRRFLMGPMKVSKMALRITLGFALIALFVIPLGSTKAWAKNIVQGRIILPDGNPAAGLRVVAMDSDFGGDVNKDDKMGEAITDAQGYYKLTYKKKNWDADVPFSKKERPDIYIRVLRNVEGRWVQVDKSNVYNDWDMNKDLTINRKLSVTSATQGAGGGKRKFK